MKRILGKEGGCEDGWLYGLAMGRRVVRRELLFV